MGKPTAYLLTWTCYGTWLHGDERGSVDDEHNLYGWPVVEPDPDYVNVSASRLKHPPVVLDAARRASVEATIAAHHAFRGWFLHAAKVRTNHVHVVAGGIEIEPGSAVGQFKAWTTRRLREAGLVGEAAEVWTKRSSTRYLWDDDSVRRAVQYVREGQGTNL